MKKYIKFCLFFSIAMLGFTNTQAQAVKKQKVILDFDIGDDFDDANALGLILASPEFEVLGVVVGFGNTPKRAQVACRFLYEVGREDIPVVQGRQTDDEFTKKHFYTKQFYWGEGFDKVKPIKQSAPDFIIEQLKKYPNEVTLVTIGPVTNLGDVMDKDPNALKLAKRVVSMFGSFYTGYGNSPIPCAEWNVKADILASQKFMASNAKFEFVGLDVTTYVLLKEEIIKLMSYRNSPLTNSILALMTLSNHERSIKEPIIYDSVAIGLLLWPELFNTRKTYVKVDDQGYTVMDESKDPNCIIATSIDVKGFHEKYTERMLTQNLMRKY
ncbi:MAG: nucleoside hydrolase [Salinivirgaceae bacterium]|jgi:purine nucleosidase|nr:nucleoside hydrolase [Salinivirgaceae bacterium]